MLIIYNIAAFQVKPKTYGLLLSAVLVGVEFRSCSAWQFCFGSFPRGFFHGALEVLLWDDH